MMALSSIGASVQIRGTVTQPWTRRRALFLEPELCRGKCAEFECENKAPALSGDDPVFSLYFRSGAHWKRRNVGQPRKCSRHEEECEGEVKNILPAFGGLSLLFTVREHLHCFGFALHALPTKHHTPKAALLQAIVAGLLSGAALTN